jgi:hypothetical protein
VSAPVTVRFSGWVILAFLLLAPGKPNHIHVCHADDEAHFWLKPTIELLATLGQALQRLKRSEFPWFKMSTIQQILDLQRQTADYLYWPDLDVDLSVESIRHPERFPLRAKSSCQPRRSPDPPPETL